MENEELGPQERQRSNNSQATLQLPDVPPPSPTQYPYKPLDQRRNDVRLLRTCSPSEIEGIVCCTVSHVSLDQSPRYEALSYTWADKTGDASASKTISLDGYPVTVTRNLEAALRKILLGDTNRILWVDALCINQADITERNAQVSRMNLVYRRALGVIAWLGEEYDDSQDAFELLGAFRARGVPRSICDVLGPAWAPGMAMPNSMVRKTYAIVKLFRRQYWTRAWVVQEVALAQELVLHCGDVHMILEEMIGACEAVLRDAIWMTEAFYSSGIGHLLGVLTQEGPNMLVRVEGEGIVPHKWRENKPDVTLGELLIQHRMKKATDPRDKVYSLLGMVAASVQNRIPIDYGLDIRNLFQKVAVFVATEEQRQSLQILAENKLPRCNNSDVDRSACLSLLSWVPDWANTQPADKLRIDRIIRWASASGTHSSEASIRDGGVLCVKGLRIGTVTRVGPMMPDLDDEELTFAPVFDVLYSWWLTFLETGKKDLIGPQGFVNFLFLGDNYRLEKFTAEELESIEREIVGHLRVVLNIYKPNDETLLPLLGRQQEPVDDNLRRKAETDLWGIAPFVRKRKAFAVAGTVCGIGPQCMEEGDAVVVMLGCQVPLVLRERAGEDGGYVNLGDAYVDGLMNGEAVAGLDGERRKLEIFELH